MRFLVVSCSIGVLAAGMASAQSVISTHSGVVQYVEGSAYLNDKPVDPKFGQFPDIKENQEFRTADGRAEVLLTPGVFLRLGENSSIRMLSTRLVDTRVEVLSGSAIVESTEIPKDNAVQLVYKNDAVRLVKQGIYRLDTEPARFEVFEGEAVVSDPSGQVTVRAGKQTTLAGSLAAENFDRKPDDQDALYRWSDRRASYVAQANVVSASAVGNNSNGYGSGYGAYGWNGLGLGLGYTDFAYNSAFLGGWAYNPLFGMYTYLPYSGFGYSPFGYTYYSPYTVGYAPTYGGSGYSYGVSRLSGLSSTSRLAHLTAVRGGESGFASSARSFGGGSVAAARGSSAGFSGAHSSSFGGGHGGGGRR